MKIDRVRTIPAPFLWITFWWKFVSQKGHVLRGIKKSGIYSIYTQTFIDRIKTQVAGRSCIEIAAGDGTLSKFLNDTGAQVTATDDHSWKHVVNFPEFVENLDAKDALKKYNPNVVLCAWPPPGNKFEKHVFANKGVETYILITSKHQFAAGNWDEYKRNNDFDVEVHSDLGKFLFPPEVDSEVIIFSRK